MNHEELLADVEASYKKGLEIMRSKNKDYAKDKDPFANFRFADLLGLGVEEAILLRVLDKMARISNLLHKEASVTDEKLEDTLLDACNYLMIIKAYRKEQNGSL